MTYEEFQRQLGKAGITAREFADIIGMNPNSVTNCSQRGIVPSHLAVIALLMGEMAEHQINFRKPLLNLDVQPKKPRGSAEKGKFGGSGNKFGGPGNKLSGSDKKLPLNHVGETMIESNNESNKID